LKASVECGKDLKREANWGKKSRGGLTQKTICSDKGPRGEYVSFVILGSLEGGFCKEEQCPGRGGLEYEKNPSGEKGTVKGKTKWEAVGSRGTRREKSSNPVPGKIADEAGERNKAGLWEKAKATHWSGADGGGRDTPNKRVGKGGREEQRSHELFGGEGEEREKEKWAEAGQTT